MNPPRIGRIHQQLYAALENVQESYELLKAGVFPDDLICEDLLEQLSSARVAVDAWQRSLEAGRVSH